MKYSFLVGAGLAAATVLVTPWNALAATHPSPRPSASSAPQADPVVSGCSFTETATTWTLDADCTATATISVPDGVTLNGVNRIITVTGAFAGAVIQNAGAAMSVENLRIAGSALTGVPPTGIQLTNASGNLTNVHVTGMTVGNGVQAGFGMRIQATGAAQTVTVTGSSASDFQKGGLVVSGAAATVNVSNSVFGPPDLLPGVIAQNTVQYSAGAGGTFTGNTVIGAPSDRMDAISTGILLFGANDVTVTGNTIGGAGVDIGVAAFDTTGATIEDNHLTATPAPPGVANHFGTTGVFVDENSSRVTTTGNTFSGWEDSIIDARTEPYIVTTSLPDGHVGRAYSAHLYAIAEDPASDLRWSVDHGSLPPGLKIENDPAIVGTPTKTGTFTFTLRVTDVVDGSSATREFTITIHPADVFLHVTKTAFPDPAAAGQPITFTISVFNGGPDAAFGVTVHDELPLAFTGFTWTCSATAAPSRCSKASGAGPISGAPVDIAARGSVVFRLHGTVPAGFSSIRNTATITPGPDTNDMAPPADDEATVTDPVGPALPLTGPDLLPEVVGGTGLVALGGLILLPTLRRKRRPGAR